MKKQMETTKNGRDEQPGKSTRRASGTLEPVSAIENMGKDECSLSQGGRYLGCGRRQWCREGESSVLGTGGHVRKIGLGREI